MAFFLRVVPRVISLKICLFAMIGSGMRVDEGWRIGLSALLFAASCALGRRLYKSPRRLRTRRGHGTNIERLAMKRK